jgi:hypothetical protein
MLFDSCLCTTMQLLLLLLLLLLWCSRMYCTGFIWRAAAVALLGPCPQRTKNREIIGILMENFRIKYFGTYFTGFLEEFCQEVQPLGNFSLYNHSSVIIFLRFYCDPSKPSILRWTLINCHISFQLVLFLCFHAVLPLRAEGLSLLGTWSLDDQIRYVYSTLACGL